MKSLRQTGGWLRRVSVADDATGAGLSLAERYTPRRRAYTVAALFIVYVFNFTDRTILSVLLPMIKEDMQMTDAQLGLLSGTVFALFYATVGLFAARLVDRGNRVKILSVALTVWSGMTALCGVAGNFWHLLLARAGVGAGESVNSPAAASIISDLYGPKNRASALGIWNSGVSVGSAAGLFLGAMIAHAYGWRAAFLAVGLPGIAMAFVLWFTVREPTRGMVDNIVDTGEQPSRWEVAKHLFARRAYRHYIAGAALSAVVSGSHIFWLPSFLSRSFGADLLTIGTALAVTTIISGITGTALGGIIADRLSRQGVKWRMLFPALCIFASIPFSIAGYTSGSLFFTLLMLTIAKFAPHTINGPGTSMVQEMAGLRMRGTAEAIGLFVVLVVAGGLGPLAIGGISDLLTAQYGDEALRYSLLTTVFISAWGATHFIFASRHIERDLKMGKGDVGPLPAGTHVA